MVRSFFTNLQLLVSHPLPAVREMSLFYTEQSIDPFQFKPPLQRPDPNHHRCEICAPIGRSRNGLGSEHFSENVSQRMENPHDKTASC